MTPEIEGKTEAEDRRKPSVEDTVLGQTAFFLQEKGDVQAAALLLDVEGIKWTPGNWAGDWTVAELLVPGWLIERFSDEVLERIRPVLIEAAERHGVEASSVRAAPALPELGPDWRDALQERLSTDTVTNHAARVRDPRPELRREGFTFDSREELRVFEALKRAQSRLAAEGHDTITIFPLPLGRVGVGNSWTPDFVVVRDGRAGLIEVDGPHHRGRFGADTTRDRHWRNSGFVHIERILVEETAKDAELDTLVQAFLKRLRSH
ncbi:hypothetical protein ACOZCG_31225 [Streptomyces pseudogriseolus]|uniref:hypothetical protein n=1 Tax=Streptomyces pseudogriseolus TaxID=36817 RepID=UPI003FA206CD